MSSPAGAARARWLRLALAAAVATTLVAGIAVVAYQVVLDGQRRREVPVETLLLADPGPQWTLTATLPAVDENGAAEPGLVRNWTDENEHLAHTVLRHGGPRQAEYEFWFGNPKRDLARDLTAPSGEPLPGGLGADRADHACVGREPPGCNIWVYWARYGQYTVSLVNFNVDAGTSRERFTHLVLETDRLMTARLPG